MKIEYLRLPTHQMALTAEVMEYDAPAPVSALTVDFGPSNPNRDRLGVAAYLAFGSFSSGDFELPVSVSPAAAAAIRADSALANVSATPVDFTPRPLPIGSGSVEVFIDDMGLHAANSLSILSSGSWNGRLRSHYQMLVGSNAFLLRRHPDDVRPHLAVAVLLAEELDADRLLLNKQVDAAELKRLQTLLNACRLGLDAEAGD